MLKKEEIQYTVYPMDKFLECENSRNERKEAIYMKNPAAIFKLKGLWEQFVQNHPKFPMFLNALKNSGMGEGSIIEVQITHPDGQMLKTNIKLTQSDLELVEQLKNIM